MRSSLVDFLNHGTLPFVGRERELQRVFSFWQATVDSHGLRAGLLLGEAGVGKSRLVEEVIQVVTGQGGAIIHAKLYPDAATSLAPLLAKGIWNSGAGRHLLKKEPEKSVESVGRALRRMCRLRPTLVIVEDIHLLEGEPLRDFATLLQMLSEDPLSLLCPTRPLDDRTYAILERFLVEEIRLQGLGGEEVGEIWEKLFDIAIEQQTVQILLDATRGNALAMRAALRGALSSGAIALDPSSRNWSVTVAPPSFAAALGRHVHLLSEGMASHLSETEHDAARRLASLGELFSREAALSLLGESDQLLEALTFKGIICISATTRPPLLGATSACPLLAFTHSLIHQDFFRQAPLHPDTIVDFIADNVPLYSVASLQLLVDSVDRISVPIDVIRKAIDRLLDVSAMLDFTPDWELGGVLWRCAEVLIASCRNLCEAEENRQLWVRAILVRLSLLRRENQSREYAQLASELLNITIDPPSKTMAESRLCAIAHGHWVALRRDYSQPDIDWKEIDSLLERFPDLQASNGYVMLLGEISNIAPIVSAVDLLRVVETRLERLFAQESLPENIRTDALHRIGKNLLMLVETTEELDKRLELLHQLEASSPSDIVLSMQKVQLFELVGRFSEAIGVLDQVAPRFKALGFILNYYTCRMIHLTSRAALGADLVVIEREAVDLCAEASGQASEQLSLNMGIRLETFAILRGDLESARRFNDSLSQGRSLWLINQLLATRSEDEVRTLLPSLAVDPNSSSVRPLAELLLTPDKTAAFGTVAEKTRDSLPRQFVTIENILVLHAQIRLLDHLGNYPSIAPLHESLVGDMQNTITTALDWLGGQKLWSCMRPLLDISSRWLSAESIDEWRHVARRIEQAYRSAHSPRTDEPRLHVSMLGSVEVEYGGERTKLRAGRLSILLGVLVADAMLDKHLSHREICRIIAPAENDQERARKAINLAVHRLREIMGHDAIVTLPSETGQNGETPRLELSLVSVDLLDASNHCAEAEAAIGDGALMRAQSAAMAALKSTRGEVPYPGLYDGFFEAAREDFDYRLRSVVIGVAERLLAEGDAEGSAVLLRLAFDLIPGDEEIAEILYETLLQLGRRTEAERVRMREALQL